MPERVSLRNVVEASGKTFLDYITQAVRDPVAIPQPFSVMAVNVALRLMFEDDYAGMVEPLQKIAAAMPIMFACNDYCDIGLAAERRRKREGERLSQKQFFGLLTLQNLLRQKLENAIDTYGTCIKSSLIKEYIADSVTLAQCHETVPPEDIPHLLELDGAIFQYFSLAVINEGRFKRFLNPVEGDTPFERIKKKYSQFLEVRPDSHPDLKSLRKMLVEEMLLKLQDDKFGSREDSLLGLRSFDGYANLTSPDNPEEVFAKLRKGYLQELEQLGFSELSAVTAETLFTVVQKIKLYLMNGENTTDDYSIYRMVMPHLPPHDHLRETLCESGYLSDMFN